MADHQRSHQYHGLSLYTARISSHGGPPSSGRASRCRLSGTQQAGPVVANAEKDGTNAGKNLFSFFTKNEPEDAELSAAQVTVQWLQQQAIHADGFFLTFI